MRPLFSAVTTPAASRDLIILSDLREHLRLKPADTANDVWLAKVISRTSMQVERFCNRIFVQQGYSDNFGVLWGDAGEPLRLSQAPVDATTFTLTIDAVLIGPTAYSLDTDAGLVYPIATGEPVPTPFTLGTGSMGRWISSSSMVAAYTGGFATIPDDVQQAVLELCTGENSGRGRDPMLRANETPGLGRQEFWVGGLPGGGTIPEYVAGLLYPYRRGLVA